MSDPNTLWVVDLRSPRMLLTLVLVGARRCNVQVLPCPPSRAWGCRIGETCFCFGAEVAHLRLKRLMFRVREWDPPVRIGPRQGVVLDADR